MLCCQDHPKYKGKRRPQIDCLGCWALWILNHQDWDDWMKWGGTIAEIRRDIQNALDREVQLLRSELAGRG